MKKFKWSPLILFCDLAGNNPSIPESYVIFKYNVNLQFHVFLVKMSFIAMASNIITVTSKSVKWYSEKNQW